MGAWLRAAVLTAASKTASEFGQAASKVSVPALILAQADQGLDHFIQGTHR